MSNVTSLSVNGTRYSIDADPDMSLLSVLRDHLGLTGSKYGCGEGQCGACTVLIDGFPRRSCITKVGTVSSKPVITIEGLGSRDQLHPLQQAFLELDALQCGYCTPGMIVAAAALLKSTPNPTRQEIIRFMEGNICRCGVYQRIIAAIQHAAKLMKEGQS